MPTNPFEYIWPGIVAAQAIYAAAKLRISDLLASGPRTIAELASDSDANPAALERLLRALASIGMFALEPDGRFRNTALTEVLRCDHSESQRNSALFLPAPFLWRPIGELYDSVRSGKAAFPRIFGQQFFDYLAAHPDDAATFNSAMTQGVAWTSPALLATYDFSRFQQLVDVGGGQGALLRDVLSANPRLRGILFDLPEVVAGASEILEGDVAARSQIVAGSFFDSVPPGASAYLMKGVIHDWPDDDAVKILQAIRRAIPPDGTLLLIENVAGADARPTGLLDLLMLVLGGRDRPEADFRSLLAATGYCLTRIINIGASSIIECHPI
jgi:hypothetical protein